MPDEQLTFDFAKEPPLAESSPPARLTRAQRLGDRAAELARRGVYIGTSSWKYPGWLGQMYDPARYATRGKLSERRFRDECLAEYATVFSTVCGDFAFYQFPSSGMWASMFARLPAGFKFALKVPEDVTMERFPRLPRYGERAGKVNPSFMDANLVKRELLDRLEPHRDKLGPLILEFSTIHDPQLREPQAFADALARMLSRLPCDEYEWAVEVRNPEFLGADPCDGHVPAGTEGAYLDVLRDYGVAHVLNSWTRMPSVREQMKLPNVFTARHVVSRWLLKPGRTYAEAVEAFSPYESVKDPYPEGRQALHDLIEQFLPDERVFYAFVNNRFEGSAIGTIEHVAG
jgi:uncharacterized protein YecE (DUF72 family)